MTPEDYAELFEERAAIMEFDADMTREDAEDAAYADLLAIYSFDFELPEGMLDSNEPRHQ